MAGGRINAHVYSMKNNVCVGLMKEIEQKLIKSFELKTGLKR